MVREFKHFMRASAATLFNSKCRWDPYSRKDTLEGHLLGASIRPQQLRTHFADVASQSTSSLAPAGFPHGVFPVSELLCISLMMRIWPTLRVYSIAASTVFKVPVWRHILCWTGARPATRRWFKQLLTMVSGSFV